jgi:hypothetical protein
VNVIKRLPGALSALGHLCVESPNPGALSTPMTARFTFSETNQPIVTIRRLARLPLPCDKGRALARSREARFSIYARIQFESEADLISKLRFLLVLAL